MKEKYIKPEINVMMNIIISNDEDQNDKKGNILIGDANVDIGGGTVSGEDDGDW